MKYGIKTAAQAALLAVGIVMVCLGVCRNEVATVLSKAIKLCLECVAKVGVAGPSPVFRSLKKKNTKQS